MNYEWIYGTYTYQLNDSNPFEVVSIDGIDLAKVEPITERGPLQDGVTDKDMRLASRVVQLVLQANTTASNTHEMNRALLNRIFTPSAVLGKLQLTYDNGNVYQINARPLGDAGVGRSAESELQLKAGIAFECPDPLWYNPVGYAYSFGIAGGGGSGFAVPTPVPTPIGLSTLNQTLNIPYPGTYKDFPVITVYGPITDLKITHQQTGKVIDFTGTTIASAHYYTIDLRYGRKFVYKDGITTDIRTGETTTASQLSTWAIEANPVVPDGVNGVTVTGTSITSVTQIYVQGFERYSGI